MDEACGKSNLAVAVFNAHAASYAQKYADVSAYAHSFSALTARLAPDASVLELACGPGNISKYVLAIRPDLKWIGTDLAPNMIDIARCGNPSAQFELMDSMALDQRPESFQCILAGFLLPYIAPNQLPELLQKCHAKLSGNGYLYCSFIEGHATESCWETGSQGDKIFMHYYPGSALIELLGNNGFEVVWQQNHPIAGERPLQDMVLIACKIKV